MKLFTHTSLLVALLLLAPLAVSAQRNQNTVVLDPNAAANLRLEFATADLRDFETTAFALGTVEPAHDAITALSSRIPGRVVELMAHLGEPVSANEELVRVESRQAGDPPPTITLRAPRGGVITACEIHLGDPIEPDRHLLEIVDLSTVEAVARLPEHYVGRLRVGESTTRIRLAAFPGEVFTGTLVRFAPLADPVGGTLGAHFELANPGLRLRPGMRAEFSVILDSREDVLSIPREAVQGEGAAPRHVFVKDFELPHAFVKVPVVTGATNDRFVEIESGLFPGDEVVTRGAYSLRFAGGGSLSLKEALDAAHGHEHAEDGSELPANGGAPAAAAGADHGHDHPGTDDHGHADGGGARPWQVATAALALSTLVLGFAAARRRHA